MKPSRLQLDNYYVTELSVSANPSHESDKVTVVKASDISVAVKPSEPREGRGEWVVELRITYAPGPEVNSPYRFNLTLQGVFEVVDKINLKKDAALINTNATSVLYSTARVILRNAMAQGPFPPLLLPTASFYDPASIAELTNKSSAE